MRIRRSVGLGLVLLLLSVFPTRMNAQTTSPEESVTRSSIRFAIDLYRQILDDETYQDDENLFISPYSIYTILALIYSGARGETADQIAEMIYLDLTPEEFQAGLASIQSTLEDLRDKGEIELAIANALFPQTGANFKDDFLELAALYMAEVLPVDYRGDPNVSRNQINSWAENRTNEKIKEIVDWKLDRATHLLLANAIYFNGDWATQFDEAKTVPAPFYLPDGQTVEVDMMTQTGVFRYLRTDSVQVLELPYVGEDVAMLIIMPNELDGITSLENTLSADNVMLLASEPSRELVAVSLPHFTLLCTYKLVDVLRGMGMHNATYAHLADFTGIGMSPAWFYIFYFAHKAFVDVNEEGTEAAAVTVAGCFPAGTPVLTAVGARTIESIDPGTNVRAFDFSTGRWTTAQVSDRHTYQFSGDIITIEVGGISIEATWNHPFLVIQGNNLRDRRRPAYLPRQVSAATAYGRWVEARDLQYGDLLLTNSGKQVMITSMSVKQKEMEVFTLQMTEHNNYAVGSLGILVHNEGEVEKTSEEEEPIPFVADQPFLFMIRDTPTGNILFMGRVGNPVVVKNN